MIIAIPINGITTSMKSNIAKAVPSKNFIFKI